VIKRIICDVLLLAIIFWGAWWQAALLAIIFVIVFKSYWEAVVAAVIMDSLYYIPTGKLWGNFGIFTVCFFLFILATEKIKKLIMVR
jgi:hypothetical protein